MLRDVDSIKNINELSFGLRTQHTPQSNVNCAVKFSAVSKVTQSRNFNCKNVRSNCAVISCAVKTDGKTVRVWGP
jgi:hypothetical protein